MLKDFINVVKNLLVCCCLIATLASQCRQEQTSDKLATQIEALKSVSVEIQECVYREEER